MFIDFAPMIISRSIFSELLVTCMNAAGQAFLSKRRVNIKNYRYFIDIFRITFAFDRS